MGHIWDIYGTSFRLGAVYQVLDCILNRRIHFQKWNDLQGGVEEFLVWHGC
jgi:hypothetical protein